MTGSILRTWVNYSTIDESFYQLIDYVNELFKGNNAFTLLDDQKVAYKAAIELVTDNDYNKQEKRTIIIEGGPGTGKSVISFNLLGTFLNKGLNTVFVAPNAAFRDIMVNRLARNHKKTRLTHLFKGSSCFVDIDENIYDVIIVDEAHRLKDSKAYQYNGNNQIEDIIKASLVNIFFIDDNQRIRPEDIGCVSLIRKIAEENNSAVYQYKLETQFRCSGANDYLDWLDYVLKINEETIVNNWELTGFDFKIFDNPNEVYEKIKKFNDDGLKARMLAGYAWKWTKDGNNNAQIEDVAIPEFNFRIPWNSRDSRTLFADDENGINQIGCIHTTQGLEFDYVGVIIGNDLRYDKNNDRLYCDWDSYKDNNGKKGLKDNPELLTSLVKNIYKILMTRGIKGCYVYICDSPLREYFKKELIKMTSNH